MIDVNGTRFQIFQSETDWERAHTSQNEPVTGESREIRWNAQRGEVTLEPKLFRFVKGRGDRPVQIDDRRGAARDRFGNWYWIAPDRQSVLVRSVGSGVTSAFWPPSPDENVAKAAAAKLADGQFVDCEVQPETPLTLQGLAVTEDHYLVVGITRPAGVLIVDLYAGGAPGQRLWFPETDSAFEPFDIATREGGGVWILGRRDKRVWELDRRFQLVSDERPNLQPPEIGGFGDADGAARECDTPPRWERSSLGWPIPATDPIAIVSLPGRGVLVLDRTGEAAIKVHWLRLRKGAGLTPDSELAISTITSMTPAPANVTTHDFALTPRGDHDPKGWVGRLYVADGEGNQAYAFGVALEDDTLSLPLINGYFPMRLFGGRALVTAGADAHYDCGDSWVKLVHQNRPRYEEAGELITPPLDSGEPGCVWHRLMLDACVPPGADVSLFTRCSDDVREVTTLEWQREPSPYLRGDGSELPYIASLDPEQHDDGHGTWESLFQRARGRYLQIKLGLRGDGRVTPRIRAMRSWYPRFSYSEKYLPAVYREDAESASFMERFLANFEGIFTTVEERIAAAQVLFDVQSAPAESLDWLGRWFGVALDPSWEEARRRLFIRHATDFFAARGTMRGLHLALRLALDQCVDETLFTQSAASLRRTSSVRIIERFRARRTARELLGDVDTAVPAPRSPGQMPRWRRKPGSKPGVGAADRTRWQAFLTRKYTTVQAVNTAHGTNWTSLDDVRLPRGERNTPAKVVADWREFVTYNPGRERQLWQDFLARRYRSVHVLNTAWNTGWSSFAVVSLPDTVTSEPGLTDWSEFEGIVLAMHAAAHRFTVMLPIPMHMRGDTPAQRRRMAVARMVLDLEKPAHTVFDMRFFWSMFRVGEARLGDDTLIGQGSRSPELMAPMVLGQGYLAESFLAAAPGRDAPARFQTGRDRVGRSTRLGGP